MGCAAIGELRAYLDGELPGEEGNRVERHLTSCVTCRRALAALRENASVARSALDRQAPATAGVPHVTWSRVRERAVSRVQRPVTLGWRTSEMFHDLLRFAGGGRVRVASGVVAALVAVTLLFTLPPVQTAAGSFLSIFRVKKFVAVTVDPASLSNLAPPTELGTLVFSGDRKPRELTVPEAERAVGFQVRTPAQIPAGLEPKPRSTMVTGSFAVTYTPDLQKVRAYLAGIGATNVSLPDNLDGAPIALQMPPSVAILYTEMGGIQRSSDGSARPAVGQRFLFLGQTTGPTMSVPDGVDVERVRSELLKVPKLPPDLVNQIKAIDDWRNTVVVPVVKGTSREVTVQGERGLLVTEAGGNGTTLLWLKGGIVYTLTGNVPEAEILAAANSMR